MASMQSFLVASAVRKPLSVLRRRGEKYTLRNSARGEAISLDDNGDAAVRHLEQWLLAEGRAVDDTTVQALRNVPPEMAVTIIDGLWSAFTKGQNQEGVDANSLAVGQTLPGVIHFGGASINMGEGLQLHIPALDFKASASIGAGQKMDVRVEEIQGAGKKDVAPNAPTLSVDAIRVGQQLRGVVKALPNFGGAFMRVGADRDVYMPAAVMPEGTQVGEEMDVWVARNQAGKVSVTPIPPKLDISSLALGEKLDGVIKQLPEFGGAFLDVGASINVYMPAVDLADDVKEGDEIEVWVKQIRDDGKVLVTPTAPKVDISSLALGEKLHGVIDRLPDFGGAFVDIGAVSNVYLASKDLTVGAQVGDEIEVWVKKILDDGKVVVMPTAPKVDISSLALGEKLHGVIDGLPDFGGAFVNIGAVSNVYITANDLTVGAKAGDEMEVWVKEVKDNGKVAVTPSAPKVDIRCLTVGDKLHGVIMPLPKFGGAFVDIGAVINGYIPAFDLTQEVEAGAEADVWVKRIGDDGKVQVALQAPEAHSS